MAAEAGGRRKEQVEKYFIPRIVEPTLTQQSLELHALASLLFVRGGMVTSVALLGGKAVIAYNDPRLKEGSLSGQDDWYASMILTGEQECKEKFDLLHSIHQVGEGYEDLKKLCFAEVERGKTAKDFRQMPDSEERRAIFACTAGNCLEVCERVVREDVGSERSRRILHICQPLISNFKFRNMAENKCICTKNGVAL